MFRTFAVGTVLGIPVRIQGLFVVFFALLGGWSLAAEGPSRALATVLVLAGAFFFVVVHEFGHALAARKLGVDVVDITIWPLGGMARLENVPCTGATEILISAAGPAVNLLIAPVLLLAYEFAIAIDFADAHPLLVLAWINLLLAGFNVIPAFPLDGGRILRCLLSRFLGFDRATRVCAAIARVIAVALCLGAFYGHMSFLAVVAVFIFIAAGQEDRSSRWDEEEESDPAPESLASGGCRVKVAPLRRPPRSRSSEEWTDRDPSRP